MRHLIGCVQLSPLVNLKSQKLRNHFLFFPWCLHPCFCPVPLNQCTLVCSHFTMCDNKEGEAALVRNWLDSAMITLSHDRTDSSPLFPGCDMIDTSSASDVNSTAPTAAGGGSGGDSKGPEITVVSSPHPPPLSPPHPRTYHAPSPQPVVSYSTASYFPATHYIPSSATATASYYAMMEPALEPAPREDSYSLFSEENANACRVM